MSEKFLRLDKWLWYARFFKSRSLATKFCSSRNLRINKTIIAKPHHCVKIEDILTFQKGPHIRVIKVKALGTRRGPAAESQALYEDLSPPQPRAKKHPLETQSPAQRAPGTGRPTKAQRRATDRLKNWE